MENNALKDQLEVEINWKEELENLSLSELVEKLKAWKLEQDFNDSSNFLKEIKAVVDQLIDTLKQNALQVFLADGGTKDDFEYKKDELALAFEKHYNNLRERLNHFYKEQEAQRTKNLTTKLNLLDQLRQLLNSNDGTQSVEQFKKIQAEWKAAGAVPSAQAKELYANFHSLVDRFFHNRSIYNDLLNLDRKKNAQAKLEVVIKIEHLLNEEKVFESLRTLQKLQEEYREIGYAAKEEGEAIHARYKEAIQKLIQKKEDYVKELEAIRLKNLATKKELISKLVDFVDFASSKIDEWKTKTNEIAQLQEEWKKIGQVPQELAKEVNQLFWSSSKKFYENKQQFFNTLEEKRIQNLQRKEAYCVEVENLLNNEDFAQTSKKIIQLQQEFNKVGQVPIKQKDSINERFKSACDAFFNRQRAKVAEQEQTLLNNVEERKQYTNQVKQRAVSSENIAQHLHEIAAAWSQLGEIPKTHVEAVQKEFTAVLSQMVHSVQDLKEEIKHDLLLKVEVLQAQAGGDAKSALLKLEKELIKQKNNLLSEIEQYKTNIEFFAKGKNAESIRAEFAVKISALEEDVKKLNKKLKILKD